MEETRGALTFEDLDPKALASQRLLQRRFKTVALTLADGNEWQVAGPPLGNDGAAEAYRDAMLKMDKSMLELAGIDTNAKPSAALDMQQATHEAAFAVLRQSYALTYEQFCTLADGALAQTIVQVSLNGEAPPTMEEEIEKRRDLAMVSERLDWALGEPMGNSETGEAKTRADVVKFVADVVVNGIPAEPTEQESAGNDSPPSESA